MSDLDRLSPEQRAVLAARYVEPAVPARRPPILPLSWSTMGRRSSRACDCPTPGFDQHRHGMIRWRCPHCSTVWMRFEHWPVWLLRRLTGGPR